MASVLNNTKKQQNNAMKKVVVVEKNKSFCYFVFLKFNISIVLPQKCDFWCVSLKQKKIDILYLEKFEVNRHITKIYTIDYIY